MIFDIENTCCERVPDGRSTAARRARTEHPGVGRGAALARAGVAVARRDAVRVDESRETGAVRRYSLLSPVP